MRPSLFFVSKLVAISAFWFGTSLMAQMPNPYGTPIPVELAKKAAAAALAEAVKNSWTMAVAVVDWSGNLVYYEKMDNTQVASAKVCIDKARTSAIYKRPSKAFQDGLAAGGVGLRILDLRGATAVEGGIPLLVDGKIIGAIGVSGDSSEHDNVCAVAGAAVIK
jgi:uncharacterized protein GlcG (DUF336 family)